MTRLEDGRWADGLHLRCRKPECPSGDLLGCYAGSQGMKSASWPISNGVQNDLTFQRASGHELFISPGRDLAAGESHGMDRCVLELGQNAPLSTERWIYIYRDIH